FCHIHDGIPITPQLPDLLRCHFEQQRRLMAVRIGFGLNIRQIQRPPRCGIDDPHQRSLRIAIVNVKYVHFHSPRSRRGGSVIRQVERSSTKKLPPLPATSPKAMLPPAPWEKRWPPARYRKPSIQHSVIAKTGRVHHSSAAISETRAWHLR